MTASRSATVPAAFRAAVLAIALAGFLSAVAAPATVAAQPAAERNAPGAFDFYLLALSWSPSFCQVSAERGNARTGEPQCSVRSDVRPYAFVVHGLWPQYERGFPRNCQVPAPRLPRAIVDSMLDLMPSPRLVFHEWDQHGTCSGLAPQAYFDLVRKARGAVRVPETYGDLSKPLMVAPGEVAEAFRKANPGLSAAGLAVVCDGRRLTEVRICLDKSLHFRDCGEVAGRACRTDKVVMPPVRGG